MARTTFKYNPSQQSVEELEQTFVGRQELLEGMLSELEAQPKGSSRQHYVIIGPRGIGKTNLLLMIYYAVKRRSELAEKWIPVQLAEESYSVVSLADFLLEILRALSAEVDGLEDQIRDISASNDDQAVVDRGTALLRKIAETRGKGILVLVDNLDMILEDQIRDQMEVHRLRSLLMAQDFITIIGASPTFFNQLTKYDSPLYNFFKTINLKELSREETEELIAKRLTMEGKPNEADALAQYRPRLRAIRHLTGGNPRLLLMLYQMCEYGEIPEVRQALETLLDELTPYFKHRVESLAPQMRKVLDTLAKSDKALTPTEIAREARVDTRQVNVQLARMKNDGLVTATPVRGKRNTYYEITERLFRIWYKMRLSRKDKNEVYFLAEFFQVWYAAGEMLDLMEHLSQQFEAMLRDADHAAAQGLLETLRIVEMASKDPQVGYAAVLRECWMQMKLGKPAEAADKLEERKNEFENLASMMTVLADLRVAGGQWSLALVSAEKAFAAIPQPEKSWLRGIWGFQPRDLQASLTDTPLLSLFKTVGGALGAVNRDTGALSTILYDVVASPDTWLCFAWWLCVLGRFEAASAAYHTAQDKATMCGDSELARVAATSHTASRYLAERLEPADGPALRTASRSLPDLSQVPDVWPVVLDMALWWSGVALAYHGSGGLPRMMEVSEVNSPLDVMLRCAADAAALTKSADTALLAAQLGTERRDIAERWIKNYESKAMIRSWMAAMLGLRENDHDAVDRERTIELRLRGKPDGPQGATGTQGETGQPAG